MVRQAARAQAQDRKVRRAVSGTASLGARKVERFGKMQARTKGKGPSLADVLRQINSIAGTDKHPGDQRTPLLDAVTSKDFLLGKGYVVDSKGRKVPLDQGAAGTGVGHAVQKTLDFTARPLYAATGALEQQVKHPGTGDPSGAAWRGLTGKERKTGSDVAKAAGLSGAAAAAAGTALDLGVGALYPQSRVLSAAQAAESVGVKAGVKAGREAEKAAKAAGRTSGEIEAAKRAAQQKAYAAAKAAHKGGGAVRVKVAGAHVPLVEKATGKASRGALRATQRVREGAVGRTARSAVRNVRPTIAPAGADKQAFKRAKSLQRQAESRLRAAQRRAENEGRTLARTATPEDIHQVEAGKAQTAAAQFLKRRFAETKQSLNDAGIPVKELGVEQPQVLEGVAVNATRKAKVAVKRTKGEPVAQGYIPHYHTSHLKRKETPVPVGRTPKGTKLGAEATRLDRRPIRAINAETPGRVVEDPAAIHVNYQAQASHRIERARLDKALFNEGKPYAGGDLGDYQSAYVFRDGKLQSVPAHAIPKGARVLDDRIVADVLKKFDKGARTGPGVAYDRVQRKWKLLATGTPGFHVRNMIGDTSQAWLRMRPDQLAKNLGTAGKALREAGRADKAHVRLQTHVPGEEMVKVKDKFGNAEQVPMGVLVQEAIDNGVLHGGYAGAELNDLRKRATEAGAVAKVKGTRRASAAAGFRNAIQNREDLTRMATYIDGRRKGLDAVQAADRSLHTHFDYGDLTPFEQQLRRIAPFYTWTARNAPFQATMLLRKPGKYAQLEALRQETAKLFGLPSDWQDKLSPLDAAQVPLGAPGPSTLAFGAPAADLGLLIPAHALSGDMKSQVGEWLTRLGSMVGPAKIPVEVLANYSSVFRGPIESDTGPLVPAPWFVGTVAPALPASVRKELGITDSYVDPRTGKKGWGWRAKADYVAKGVLPGGGSAAISLGAGGNSRGQTSTDILTKFGTGLNPKPFDATYIAKQESQRLFQQVDDLKRQQAVMRQEGKQGSPAYKRLSREIQKANDAAQAQRTKAGYRPRVKPSQAAPGSAVPGSGGGSGGPTSGSAVPGS